MLPGDLWEHPAFPAEKLHGGGQSTGHRGDSTAHRYPLSDHLWRNWNGDRDLLPGIPGNRHRGQRDRQPVLRPSGIQRRGGSHEHRDRNLLCRPDGAVPAHRHSTRLPWLGAYGSIRGSAAFSAAADPPHCRVGRTAVQPSAGPAHSGPQPGRPAAGQPGHDLELPPWPRRRVGGSGAQSAHHVPAALRRYDLPEGSQSSSTGGYGQAHPAFPTAARLFRRRLPRIEDPSHHSQRAGGEHGLGHRPVQESTGHPPRNPTGCGAYGKTGEGNPGHLQTGDGGIS